MTETDKVTIMQRKGMHPVFSFLIALRIPATVEGILFPSPSTKVAALRLRHISLSRCGLRQTVTAPLLLMLCASIDHPYSITHIPRCQAFEYKFIKTVIIYDKYPPANNASG